jgi:hypothetical protein
VTGHAPLRKIKTRSPVLRWPATWAGPFVTGILAVYPISSTSLMFILQPRLGGRAAAAVSANCVRSLFGISFSLAALHLTIVPFGASAALAAALAIPVGWNLTVWSFQRRTAFAVS